MKSPIWEGECPQLTSHLAQFGRGIISVRGTYDHHWTMVIITSYTWFGGSRAARYPSYYGYEDHNGGSGGVLLPPVVWVRGSQGLRCLAIPIGSMGLVILTYLGGGNSNIF